MKSKRPSKPGLLPRVQAHRRAGTGQRVIVCGAGGNIGSHLLPLIARLEGVGHLTLVDPDLYEPKNIHSQDIVPSEIGQPKAEVQARRARRLNPRLEVSAIVDRIENVPLGLLRGDMILAGLDSKESRRWVNQIAWRLGVPWIDAGVEASGLLARINFYVPGEGQPCLECSWDERDYAQLAVRHPCQPDDSQTPPSNAPACLGGLAAALQAIECQKWLKGEGDHALMGRQILMDAATHQYFVTSYRRNPSCRFDHQTCQISPWRAGPRDLSLGSVLRLGQRPAGQRSALLSFGGKSIIKRLDCPGCGFTRAMFRLEGRIRAPDRRCPQCGRELLAAGFNMKAHLVADTLGPRDAARSLASLGLRAGDVITISDGRRERHYELGAATRPPAPAGNPKRRRLI